MDLKVKAAFHSQANRESKHFSRPICSKLEDVSRSWVILLLRSVSFDSCLFSWESFVFTRSLTVWLLVKWIATHGTTTTTYTTFLCLYRVDQRKKIAGRDGLFSFFLSVSRTLKLYKLSVKVDASSGLELYSSRECMCALPSCLLPNLH